MSKRKTWAEKRFAPGLLSEVDKGFASLGRRRTVVTPDGQPLFSPKPDASYEAALTAAAPKLRQRLLDGDWTVDATVPAKRNRKPVAARKRSQAPRRPLHAQPAIQAQ